MTWIETYRQDIQPTMEQMDAFIGNPMWKDINDYLQTAYAAKPKQTYSGCSGQPGWNVKYAKGGKSLCTLYPMKGYFIALVVIGEKERAEMELLMPSFTPYTQTLYAGAGELMGAKWLMTEITDEAILEDVKRLIALRRAPR